MPGKSKAARTKQEGTAPTAEAKTPPSKQNAKKQKSVAPKAAAPKAVAPKAVAAPVAAPSPPRVREVRAPPRPSSGPQRATPSAVTRRPVAANSLCAAQRRSADAQNVWNFDMRPPDREALIAEQDAMLARLKHANYGTRGTTSSPPHVRPKSSTGLSRRPLIGNIVKPLAAPTPHSSSEPQQRWNCAATPLYREEEQRRAVPSQATVRPALPLPSRGRQSFDAGKRPLVEVVNAALLGLSTTADD